PVVVGGPGVLAGLLHDHDDVAALVRPLQGTALQPDPDRVAQQRDDERHGPGATPLERPGQRVRPVALLPGGSEYQFVDLGADRRRGVPVEPPGPGGHVAADRLGDVDQAGRAALDAGRTSGHTTSATARVIRIAAQKLRETASGASPVNRTS